MFHAMYQTPNKPLNFPTNPSHPVSSYASQILRVLWHCGWNSHSKLTESHWSEQDLSSFRSLNNLIILTPYDPIDPRSCQFKFVPTLTRTNTLRVIVTYWHAAHSKLVLEPNKVVCTRCSTIPYVAPNVPF